MWTAVLGLEYLPYFSGKFKQHMSLGMSLRNFFDDEIKAHERQVESGELLDEESKDLVHRYIEEIHKCAGRDTSFE